MLRQCHYGGLYFLCQQIRGRCHVVCQILTVLSPEPVLMIDPVRFGGCQNQGRFAHWTYPPFRSIFLANLGCLNPRATANYIRQVRYTLPAICYCAAISYRRSTTDVTHRSPERTSGPYHRYVSSSYGHQFSYICLMQHQSHQSSLVHLCPYVQLKILSISDSSSYKFFQSSSSSGSSSVIESSTSRSSSALCSLQVQCALCNFAGL